NTTICNLILVTTRHYLFPYSTLFRSGGTGCTPGGDPGGRDDRPARGEDPRERCRVRAGARGADRPDRDYARDQWRATGVACRMGDRKSTRLNSSHVKISYAIF